MFNVYSVLIFLTPFQSSLVSEKIFYLKFVFLFQGENTNSGKIDWNLEGCFQALEKVSQKGYFLSQTKDTLRLFIDKPMKLTRARVVDPLQDAKASLKAALDRIQAT